MQKQNQNRNHSNHDNTHDQDSMSAVLITDAPQIELIPNVTVHLLSLLTDNNIPDQHYSTQK